MLFWPSFGPHRVSEEMNYIAIGHEDSWWIFYQDDNEFSLFLLMTSVPSATATGNLKEFIIICCHGREQQRIQWHSGQAADNTQMSVQEKQAMRFLSELSMLQSVLASSSTTGEVLKAIKNCMFVCFYHIVIVEVLQHDEITTRPCIRPSVHVKTGAWYSLTGPRTN